MASLPDDLLPSMMRRNWSILTSHPWLALLSATAVILAFPLLPKALIWPARALLLALFLVLASRFVSVLRASRRKMVRAVFALVATLIGLGMAYGLLELSCWVYLQKVPLSGDPFVMTERQRQSAQAIADGMMRYVIHSPTLGATIGENQTSPDGLYRSNAAGFRANREYSKEIPPGKIRVLCFGDSFTHCDEVENHETWEHYAERADPGIEFLNFGVPGYGITQAYLRYTETVGRFQADYVIIGCMTEDMKRGVNVYFPFRQLNPEQSTTALASPYASLNQEGKLEVNPPFLATREDYARFLENPQPMLKKMAKADLLFMPQPPTPFLRLAANRWERLSGALAPLADYILESFRLAFNSRKLQRIFRGPGSGRTRETKNRIAEISRLMFVRFAEEVRKNGAVPVVVWFPSPMNLVSHNEGKHREYREFIEFFAEKSIHAVDTMDWIEEIGGIGKPLPLDTIMKRVHFAASTNAIIGRRIAERIRGLHHRPEPG